MLKEDKMILSQQAIYAVSGIIFAMFILFVGNQNYIFLAISAVTIHGLTDKGLRLLFWGSQIFYKNIVIFLKKISLNA